MARICRRQFLRRAAMAGLGATVGSRGAVAGKSSGTGLGLVTYSLGIHQKAAKAGAIDRDLSDPVGFLDACRDFGAGGMQFPLGPGGEATVRDVREAAEKHGMHVEAIVGLPKAESEMERFERELVTARAAGVTVARTVMLPGRRYEQFKTREAFVGACSAGLAALERAEPVARRIGVRLAVENHKDHRTGEKIDVLRRIGSEFEIGRASCRERV